jgi:hypothetical protein
VRIGAKDVLARWLKASRALKKEEQIYGLFSHGITLSRVCLKYPSAKQY